MTYKGHTVGGVLAAIAAVRVLPVTTTLALAVAAAALIGALAPDLDASGAYLARRTGPLSWLIRRTLSNPLLWWLIGDRLHGALRLPARGTATWVVRGLGWCLGMGRADATARARGRLAAGRAAADRLAGHRALSHSVVGWGLGTIACGTLVAGLEVAYRGWGAGRWVLLDRLVHPPVGLPGWWPTALGPAGWTVGVCSVGFALGMLSHLALDMMTVSGVPLALPWSTRRYFLLPSALRVHST